MISKCVAFLVAALMLANCCASGSGCAPTAGTPVAWDGLGPAPADEAPPPEPQPKQHVRASALDAAAGERSKAQPKDEWEQEQAADQADEARLKRKLMICRACQTTDPARDDAAGGSR